MLVAVVLLCSLAQTAVSASDLIPIDVLLGTRPPPGKVRIAIAFEGRAFEEETVYQPGTSFIESRTVTQVRFSGSCSYLAEKDRVRPGYVALCDAGKAGSSNMPYVSGGGPSVSGSITYTSWNPVTFAAQTCVGKVSFRRGAQWLIGGTVDTPTVLAAESGAPIVLTAATGANQIVVKSSNPALGCTGLTLQNAQNARGTNDYGSYRLNRLMPFPGTATNHWSAPISYNLIQGTATFDAYQSVHVNTNPADEPPSVAADDTKEEAKTGSFDLMTGLQQFWDAAQQGLNSAFGPVTVVLPSGGTMNATFTSTGSATHAPLLRAGQTAAPDALFTIDQTLHAGLNELTPQLTPLGQAVLAGTASAPTIDATVTFTPTQGSPITVTQTFTPTVVPAVTSVQFTGSQTDPTIIVRGHGLAPLPPQDPAGSPAGHNGCPAETGQTGSDYGVQLQINDLTKKWGAGFNIPTATSCIGLIPTKVTPGELDLRLGSFYSKYYPKFTLAPGDEVQVVANGAPIDVHVAYGAPVTN
jgi:hypothetical protein